jgi:hypothetical protein
MTHHEHFNRAARHPTGTLTLAQYAVAKTLGFEEAKAPSVRELPFS